MVIRSKTVFQSIAFVFLPVFFLSSCFSSKPIPYFQENGGVDTAKVQQFQIPEYVIQKGDILNIMIYSDNPEATAIYNQASGRLVGAGGQGSTQGNASGGVTPGYLVDVNGNIRLHAIGEFKAEGLTRKELEKEVNQQLEELGTLMNPYCIVRVTNFKVTVLGEVNNPGVYTLPSEKASILEVLGMAGDINMFGRKDQVLLIREDQGSRTYTNLNLTDPLLFSSPEYYVRQNDVLIVNADKRKMTPRDELSFRYIALAFSAITTLSFIYTIFN